MNELNKEIELEASTDTAIDYSTCYAPLSHGSLFSGIGGFDLAAHWMGWKNVFQCEKDEWCRKVLEKNFPNTKKYDDIKNFNAEKYEGSVDVISGGFPCQPFSVAGNKKGKSDDRYLWEEMLRVVKEIKPSFVVGENVPGIIGMALDTVLFDLENEGYTTETYIIPACSKNAWHRRDRVWIIAHSHDNRNYRTSRPNDRETKKKRVPKRHEVEQSGKSGSIFTNANDPRRKEQREQITNGAQFFAPKCSSWWEAEPRMGRVVDGLPRRVDRIKGLGNAIVPQVAFQVFKAINEFRSSGA